jgi:hypothetical protein
MRDACLIASGSIFRRFPREIKFNNERAQRGMSEKNTFTLPAVLLDFERKFKKRRTKLGLILMDKNKKDGFSL